MADDRVRVFVERDGQWRSFEPLSYSVDLDMLELADAWSLRFPFDRALHRWVDPDAQILIELNGAPLCFGFVDDRKRRIDKGGGSFLDISGRDKGGRLVDSAAPLMNLSGLGIIDLAKAMVMEIDGVPLFPVVTSQNARNRRLMVGGGRKAKVSNEPPIESKPSKSDRRIQPGQTRAQVLENWLEEAGLLGWSSADGEEFCVGKPNYAQESQFSLFVPAARSRRKAEGNVLELDVASTAGERYARIIVLGSGKGNLTNYGQNVALRIKSAGAGRSESARKA